LDELGRRYPGLLTAVPLDVASLDSVRAAALQVSEMVSQVDLLINNAGVTSPNENNPITISQDYAEMHRVLDVNSLGPLRMVEVFLPLVAHSTLKRLCFVSSEAGSIGASTRQAWFGYCMSKAALNMAVKNLFNDLRPQGFTFRLYHPGWMRSYMGGKKNLHADLELDDAADAALAYFLSGLAGEALAPDENQLVLRDYLGKVYPW